MLYMVLVIVKTQHMATLEAPNCALIPHCYGSMAAIYAKQPAWVLLQTPPYPKMFIGISLRVYQAWCFYQEMHNRFAILLFCIISIGTQSCCHLFAHHYVVHQRCYPWCFDQGLQGCFVEHTPPCSRNVWRNTSTES